jgi:F-type H+-transporting ATPase subunit delta
MATTRQTPLAIGDIYAEALLEAAQGQGALDEVAEQFDSLIAYMDTDPQFAAFLAAPTVDDDAREATLKRLFGERMTPILLNALLVLNRRSRSDILRAVHEQFCHRLLAARNQVAVSVRSATALSDAFRQQLAALFGERLGKQVRLREHVEPDLLGGMIVQIGDRRLDASIARQVEALRIRLRTRANDEIRRGRRFMTEETT